MGIYLKGIKMPIDGNETIIRIQPDGTVLDQYGHHLIMTAVSVPSHGDLIDRNALYEIVKKRTRNWAGGWNDIECVLTGNDVKNAPTIIQAEEDI